MTIIIGCLVSHKVWHAKEPSLLKGHECRIGQNVQPFTGNGDVSIWVKNSWVRQKFIKKKKKNPANIHRRYMTGRTLPIQRKAAYNNQSQQFIVIDGAATVQLSQIIIQNHNAWIAFTLYCVALLAAGLPRSAVQWQSNSRQS